MVRAKQSVPFGIFVWLPESSLLRALKRVCWLVLGLRHCRVRTEHKYIFQSQPILLADISIILSARRFFAAKFTMVPWRRMGANLICTLYLRRRRQHHYILSLTVSKRDHISVHQLHISACIYQLAIELRAVRTLQINQVGFHFVRLVSILVNGSLEAELNHYTKLA